MLSPQKNVRRNVILAIVALLTLATLTTGCQRGRVGARCKTTDWGDDGGKWVLQCRKGRWVRALTKVDAAKFLQAINAPKATTPPDTAPPATTPPVPALTSFGDLDSRPVGNGPNEVAPGTYVTRATVGGCGIRRTTPSGDLLGDLLLPTGPLFFSIPAGDARITTAGGCTWTPAGGAQSIASDGNGVYRVGTEIQPGLYTFDNPLNMRCFWETSNRLDGSLASITDISFSTGPQLVEVRPTDTAFLSSGCGRWTAQPSLPNRYFEMITHPSDPILGGYRSFLQGGRLTVSISASTSPVYDEVTVSGNGWTLRARSPEGTLFADTDPADPIVISGAWSTSQAELAIAGPPGACGVTPAAFTVSNVHRTGGQIDTIDITYAHKCAADLMSYGSVHIAP